MIVVRAQHFNNSIQGAQYACYKNDLGHSGPSQPNTQCRCKLDVAQPNGFFRSPPAQQQSRYDKSGHSRQRTNYRSAWQYSDAPKTEECARHRYEQRQFIGYHEVFIVESSAHQLTGYQYHHNQEARIIRKLQTKQHSQCGHGDQPFPRAQRHNAIIDLVWFSQAFYYRYCHERQGQRDYYCKKHRLHLVSSHGARHQVRGLS